MTRLTPLGVRCLICRQPVYGCPTRQPRGEKGWMRVVCRHCNLRGYPFLVKPFVITTVTVITPGTPK